MIDRTRVLTFRNSPLLVVALALMLGIPGNAAAASEQTPSSFMEGFGDQVVAMLGSGSPAVREQAFRALLTANFDLAAIGRYVVGEHWTTANDGQRTRFQDAFEDFLVASYSGRLSDYAGRGFSVSGAEQDGEAAVVRSRVPGLLGVFAGIDWHLKRDGDAWRILDVVLGGISMASTQRSEFTSVIRASAGRFDGLIDGLRRKADQLVGVKDGRTQLSRLR